MTKQIQEKSSLLIQLDLGERLTEKVVMILLGFITSFFSFVVYANSQDVSLDVCNLENPAEVESELQQN